MILLIKILYLYILYDGKIIKYMNIYNIRYSNSKILFYDIENLWSRFGD